MVQRKFYRKTYKKNIFKTIVLWLIFIFVGLLFIGISGMVLMFVYFTKDFPRPEEFTERIFVQSSKIYDQTGQVLLYELYGEEKREVVKFGDISKDLKNAVLVTEDSNFYTHRGLDFKAIVRSILADIRLGQPLYGASTISQQLIRSTFLGREKTAQRKFREIVLTLELERRYSKDQIFEWYLNQISFSPNIYGVQTASKTFFNKQAKDLNLPESAVLASLIQRPSYLSPFGQHKDQLLKRKDYVLDRMAQEQYITKDQAEAAKKEEIKFADPGQAIKAPHFVFYVLDYLTEKYGEDFLKKEGLKIYTSLDWDLQKTAEIKVKEGAEKNRKNRAYNAALVATDPKTGEILSMVGSADWFGEPYPKGCTPGQDCLFDPKVNVATYGTGRQPGSSFKPFVYATAFQKGYTDSYVVIDEETNFGSASNPYIPKNYDGLFRGAVTLRQSLAQSLNIPSVYVLAYLAGYRDSISMAQKMGITTLKDPSRYGLSIVLGGGEVKLLDMVSAYGVFAADGMRQPPVSILRIEDSKGKILEETKITPRRILEKESARLITDILTDNNARAPIFGSNSIMHFENYQVAAKTGTTGDYRDGWIIGYTPSIVVGVWGGNSNNAPMAKEPGMVIAGPIWRAFMNEVLPKLPQESFPEPEIPYQPPEPSISPSPEISHLPTLQPSISPEKTL